METSFAQTMGLIGGLAMFVAWVLSDLLEEQMIGSARRERQRAVKRAEKRDRKPDAPSRPLPRAVARARSAVASRPAP